MRQSRPRTVTEWITELDRRLRSLEAQRYATVGNWVLEQAEDGSLVARHAPSGTVQVLAPPAS